MKKVLIGASIAALLSLTVTDSKGQTATAQKVVDCRKFFESAMCYSF